jgi:septal ring factor EnvC (AmiA/AmiB activator)
MKKAEAEAKAGETKDEIKKRAKAIVSAAPAVSSAKITLTPEEKVLADNFKANKGKLPWPVEKGFVSLPYGDQPHPQFPSLRVHNSGVEITTDQGSNARAVFAGEVTSVMVLSPVNKAVMIQHGDYFTVYQNLSSVNVSKGDKVSIKQNIGKVRTNGETGRTVLKFTISQNTTYNNPSTWLFNM